LPLVARRDVPTWIVVRNLLVGLLWLWLAMSLAIYGYRIVRRIGRGSKGEGQNAATSELATTVPRVERSSPPRIPPPAAPPASVPRDPSSDPSRDSGTRSGLFAPGPVAPASEPRPTPARSEARRTVAELLHGITMPCELSPVVTTDRIDPYRVVFSTTSAPAEVVGASVGDELERLGFALTSIADNRLLASMDGEDLTVTLHADPSTVTIGETAAYPTMPSGSVVVEFRV
jgi:hypothetical protein